MGGAVSISAPTLDSKTLYMQDLVNDADKISALFKDMASHGKCGGGSDSKSALVSLADILLYVEKEINPELSQHYKGMVEMIKESFYYVVGYRKNTRLEVTSKRFHAFMNAMFMFSHLWKIFAAADDHIDDNSIFIGEFIRAKEKIRSVDGVKFTKEISDEEWRQEFKKIDSGGAGGGNGSISFREFASYCCSNVVTPEAYAKACGVKKQKEVGYVAPPKPELKQIDFKGAIHHEINAVVPSCIVRRSSSSRKFSSVRKLSTSSSKNCSRAMSKVGSKSNLETITDTTVAGKKTNATPPVKKKAKESSHSRSGARKRNAKVKGSKKAAQVRSKACASRTCREPSLDVDAAKPPIYRDDDHHTTNDGKDDEDDDDNNDNTNDDDDNDYVNEKNEGGNKEVSRDSLSMDDTMDEFSSPVERATIMDVVVSERKVEEIAEVERNLQNRVRPLYRPRSAGEVYQEVKEFRSWVNNEDLKRAQCKSWVPSSASQSLRRDTNPISGFGISGIDDVMFAYDMDEVHAEANAHKKYMHRRRPKGNLWQPKHTRPRFQRDDAAQKCF